MVTGNVHNQEITRKRPHKERQAKLSCTGEGINYIIECIGCRKAGKRRVYYGESARSGYQRGKEHSKEIEDGVLAHPLVSHFWEEHSGRK